MSSLLEFNNVIINSSM